jgi:hypothetical protein
MLGVIMKSVVLPCEHKYANATHVRTFKRTYERTDHRKGHKDSTLGALSIENDLFDYL